MKKLLTVLILLIVCGICFHARAETTALNVLTKREPNVKWNAKSQISGDFDFDGVPDFALRGRKNNLFVLGIVKGALNDKSKHWTMEFGEDAGDQGGLCSVSRAVITVENLDRDYVKFAAEYLEADSVKTLKNLPKNSKGIDIADGMCDSFHVFFDKKSKQFTWWRI